MSRLVPAQVSGWGGGIEMAACSHLKKVTPPPSVLGDLPPSPPRAKKGFLVTSKGDPLRLPHLNKVAKEGFLVT